MSPPRFPPTRAVGRGRAWYRGDCHVHSVHSGGAELTAEQLAVAARDTGLDFIATTEHNQTEFHGEWGALADDDLMVILGQEVRTRTGHWLALGIEAGRTVDAHYGVGDDVVDRHLRQVRDAGGLCVAAHPHAPYPTGEFEYPLEDFDAIEVWNGLWASDLPWNADNEAALADWDRSLRSGRWLPAMGNSDAHLAGQIAVPHTVVLAEELSVEAILEGIRKGRSWIAGSTAVELAFEVRTADGSVGIGDRLKSKGGPAEVVVEISGVPNGEVGFHTDRGMVQSAALPATGSATLEWATTPTESAFVRVEVRHTDGQMTAMTNPIMLS